MALQRSDECIGKLRAVGAAIEPKADVACHGIGGRIIAQHVGIKRNEGNTRQIQGSLPESSLRTNAHHSHEGGMRQQSFGKVTDTIPSNHWLRQLPGGYNLQKASVQASICLVDGIIV